MRKTEIKSLLVCGSNRKISQIVTVVGENILALQFGFTLVHTPTQKTQHKYLINIINAPKGGETTSFMDTAAHLVHYWELLFLSFAIISKACCSHHLHFLILNLFFFCSSFSHSSIHGVLLLPLPEHEHPFTSSWQHHPLRGTSRLPRTSLAAAAI